MKECCCPTQVRWRPRAVAPSCLSPASSRELLSNSLRLCLNPIVLHLVQPLHRYSSHHVVVTYYSSSIFAFLVEHHLVRAATLFVLALAPDARVKANMSSSGMHFQLCTVSQFLRLCQSLRCSYSPSSTISSPARRPTMGFANQSSRRSLVLLIHH